MGLLLCRAAKDWVILVSLPASACSHPPTDHFCPCSLTVHISPPAVLSTRAWQSLLLCVLMGLVLLRKARSKQGGRGVSWLELARNQSVLSILCYKWDGDIRGVLNQNSDTYIQNSGVCVWSQMLQFFNEDTPDTCIKKTFDSSQIKSPKSSGWVPHSD